MKTILPVVFALAFLLLGGDARAEQEHAGESIAPQNPVSHADVALTASAAAVPILNQNLSRVSALCRVNPGQTSSNTARIGDSTTAATTGAPMAVGDSVMLSVTGAIYGYSATGATVNCTETVRP